jgi:hypothetical protein
MLIKVNKLDIERGRRHKCSSCPVANAIKRQLSVNDVHVDYGFIKVNGSISETPIEVRSFMLSYDQYNFVHPFEFSLKVKQ